MRDKSTWSSLSLPTNFSFISAFKLEKKVYNCNKLSDDQTMECSWVANIQKTRRFWWNFQSIIVSCFVAASAELRCNFFLWNFFYSSLTHNFFLYSSFSSSHFYHPHEEEWNWKRGKKFMFEIFLRHNFKKWRFFQQFQKIDAVWWMILVDFWQI